MTRTKLAEQLRERQIQKGYVPASMVRGLSDDGIIESYFTCCECGTKALPDETLGKLIDEARSAEHLFELVDEQQCAHARAKAIYEAGMAMTKEVSERVLTEEEAREQSFKMLERGSTSEVIDLHQQRGGGEMRDGLKKIDTQRVKFTGIFERYGERRTYRGWTEKTILLKNVCNEEGEEVTDHISIRYCEPR